MNRRFLGHYMQQHEDTIPTFDRFFDKFEPQRIIELGTSNGGFTTFLGLYAYVSDAVIHTYDKIECDPIYIPLLNILPVTRLICNIFEKEYAISREILRNGRTLLLCDNGNKIKEFEIFSKYLKLGDIIMVHDYVRERPERGICEITYSDIADFCEEYNIEEFMSDLFRPVKWFCGLKSR